MHNRTVLELGAGAGLPGLVSGILGAEKVVISDYPDPELIENLEYNIRECALLSQNVPSFGSQASGREPVIAQGFIWGSDTASLLYHINYDNEETASSTIASPQQLKRLSRGRARPRLFDTLILSDLLFNHSCHKQLMRSMFDLLEYTKDARVLIFFTPHRPWLMERDMQFVASLRKEDKLWVKPCVSSPWFLTRGVFEEDEGKDLSSFRHIQEGEDTEKGHSDSIRGDPYTNESDHGRQREVNMDETWNHWARQDVDVRCGVWGWEVGWSQHVLA